MLENEDKWIQAGKITGEALAFGKTLVKPDAKILDVANQIEEKIRELGGEIAFPVNISFSTTAAHDTPAPDDERVFGEEIIKLDCGAHVEGCIGDSALTVDLTKQNEDLLKASRNAVNAALKIAIPGTTLGQMGEVINSEIEALGFRPVVNLSGHSLDEYDLHAGASIPNYDNKDDSELEEDDTIAIEPFATTGAGKVVDGSNPNIFSLTGIKPVRSDSSRMFLKQAAQFTTLPFAKRWIQMPAMKINLAVAELSNLGILHRYPPLVEKEKGLVSQAEHSVIVKDKPIITTKVD